MPMAVLVPRVTMVSDVKTKFLLLWHAPITVPIQRVSMVERVATFTLVLCRHFIAAVLLASLAHSVKLHVSLAVPNVLLLELASVMVASSAIILPSLALVMILQPSCAYLAKLAAISV